MRLWCVASYRSLLVDKVGSSSDLSKLPVIEAEDHRRVAVPFAGFG